uniref:Uncharacterized protein n=1 Tax=Oryza rufipogon TaxID=4529 RepID=A0A0E0N0G3_ORYRU
FPFSPRAGSSPLPRSPSSTSTPHPPIAPRELVPSRRAIAPPTHPPPPSRAIPREARRGEAAIALPLPDHHDAAGGGSSTPPTHPASADRIACSPRGRGDDKS